MEQRVATFYMLVSYDLSRVQVITTRRSEGIESCWVSGYEPKLLHTGPPSVELQEVGHGEPRLKLVGIAPHDQSTTLGLMERFA